MATTAIWNISGRVDQVLNYISNPEKTAVKDIPAMIKLHGVDKVIKYTTDDIKTERQLFVHGINCDNTPHGALQQFKRTKQKWAYQSKGIVGNNTAFHGYQSFKPGEVSPETAHAIGLKLAKQMWGDRYEVLVSTHVNKGHLHNHFVLNSVSFIDGKKYYDGKSTYRRLRELSDNLCREFGLSVIEAPEGNSKHYAEWKAGQEGKPSIRSLIREKIDQLIPLCLCPEELYGALRSEGYTVNDSPNHKYITVKPPGAVKMCRLYKLGKGYTEDDIATRTYENSRRKEQLPLDETTQKKHYRITHSLIVRRKPKGLRALYYSYLYKMGVLPKKEQSSRNISFLYKQDIIKLDNISAEARLLCRNHIDTAQQLSSYKEGLIEKLKALATERQHLRYKTRAKITPEQLGTLVSRIADLTGKIRTLRKEVGLCDDIEIRSGVIKERIETEHKAEQNKSNEKEDKPYELWR